MREFENQHLANTAKSFAKARSAGHQAPDLFEAIAQEAQGRVGQFSALDLKDMALAFARAGHKAPALFEAIAQQSQRRVGQFGKHHLIDTAWAFALTGHEAPALFEAI